MKKEPQARRGEARSFLLMLTKEKQSEIKLHLGKGSFLPNKCMSNQILYNSFSKTCCTWGGKGGAPCLSKCSPNDDAHLNSHSPSLMQNVGTQMVLWIQNKRWKITNVDGLIFKCERVERIGGKSSYGLKQQIP
jgi:hypothetical protein